MRGLLGLHGAKQSGKSTAAMYIADWCKENGFIASSAGFADKLKLSAMRIFEPDCTLEEAIEWADVVKTSAEISVYKSTEFSPGAGRSFSISGREYLQRFGTESHRDVFGDDFWVNQLLPYGPNDNWRDNFLADTDLAIITDVRFQNEARRIMQLGGTIWQIQRSDLQSDDAHASELPLPDSLVDVYIDNNGTLEDFRDSLIAKVQKEFRWDSK